MISLCVYPVAGAYQETCSRQLQTGVSGCRVQAMVLTYMTGSNISVVFTGSGIQDPEFAFLNIRFKNTCIFKFQVEIFSLLI